MPATTLPAPIKAALNLTRLAARDTGKVQLLAWIDEAEHRRLITADEAYFDTDEAQAFNADPIAIAWPDGDYDTF